MTVHSEWIPHCPQIKPGDTTTMLAAPVTCPYCKNALRLTVAVAQKG